MVSLFLSLELRGISRSTQCSVSLVPATRAGQKASSIARDGQSAQLRTKQKPSQHHPWPAGQGKTLRVFGKWESFHHAKDRMCRETFYWWQKEVRIMKLACMWEYFTAKTKGVIFSYWMQRSDWASVVLIFLSGGWNKVQNISHGIIMKISKTLSWLLQLEFSISNIKIYLFHENLW